MNGNQFCNEVKPWWRKRGNIWFFRFNSKGKLFNIFITPHFRNSTAYQFFIYKYIFRFFEADSNHNLIIKRPSTASFSNPDYGCNCLIRIDSSIKQKHWLNAVKIFSYSLILYNLYLHIATTTNDTPRQRRESLYFLSLLVLFPSNSHPPNPPPLTSRRYFFFSASLTLFRFLAVLEILPDSSHWFAIPLQLVPISFAFDLIHIHIHINIPLSHPEKFYQQSSPPHLFKRQNLCQPLCSMSCMLFPSFVPSFSSALMCSFINK